MLQRSLRFSGKHFDFKQMISTGKITAEYDLITCSHCNLLYIPLHLMIYAFAGGYSRKDGRKKKSWII